MPLSWRSFDTPAPKREKLGQAVIVERLNVIGPANQQLDQLVHLAHAVLGVLLALGSTASSIITSRSIDRVGVNFTLAAFLGQGPDDLPDVVGCLEEIATVIRQMALAHEAPGFKLLEAHADVRTRNPKRFGDLLRMERAVG